jgi:hypothetical protein
MSRYEIPGLSCAHTVIVGWDPPLGTLFAQVQELGKTLFWVGTRLEEITRVRDLAEVLKQYAVVPVQIRGRLIADQDTEGFRPGVGTELLRQLKIVVLIAVGLLVLNAPAFAEAGCRDRVEQLERELDYTRQELSRTQTQLRQMQRGHAPYYRPYGYGGYGYGYGQGPLGQTNRTLQELEQMRRHLDNLGR